MRWHLIIIGLFCSALSASNIKEGSFINDDELEYVFKGYLAKIYKVAGMDPKNIRIFFISDTSTNAAASIKHTYFVNTGLVLHAEDVGEVLGVLAHEVSHVASRHVERRFGAISQMQRSSLALAAIGALGAVALGNPALAAAGIAGATGTAMRSASHYSQGQEGAADQGAIKYAEKLGWSLRGLHRLLSRLKSNDYLLDSYVAPYVRTHPLTSERLNTLEAHIQKSKYSDAPFDPDLISSFQRIKAKIEAYTLLPNQVLAKYHRNDSTVSARYARAIAYLRSHNYYSAHKLARNLIKDFPDDPYFYELKGAIFLEEGKLSQAIPLYEKSVRLRPDSYILKMQMAQLYVSSNSSRYYPRAKKLLDELEFAEYNAPDYWILRATVYGRFGKEGYAQWMLAEAEALQGNKDRVIMHANRAKKKLKSSDKVVLQRIKDLLRSVESS